MNSAHRDEMARASPADAARAGRGAGGRGVRRRADALVAEYGPDAPDPGRRGGPARRRAYDRAAQEQRAQAAQRQLAQLGKVNPLALEEFAALEERHAFLATQLEDLSKTRRDLLTVIKEVDDRVQQVFASAYEDTAREFEDVFGRLFPGGEGRLVLTEPDDMLATGIEVEARPPGKKVKRLSLLSGGERSLTAIALLVAIFRARPSPFYVLDEVEAALDDTNLRRLLEIFDELRDDLPADHHHAPEADDGDRRRLYGVTMRGDGVSTVISQRLRERETPPEPRPLSGSHGRPLAASRHRPARLPDWGASWNDALIIICDRHRASCAAAASLASVLVAAGARARRRLAGASAGTGGRADRRPGPAAGRRRPLRRRPPDRARPSRHRRRRPPAAPAAPAPRPPARRRSRRRRPGGWSGCAPGWPARSRRSAAALLSLLSRDTLDDDAWDEIEDTLLTADMGVAPARAAGRASCAPRSRWPAPGTRTRSGRCCRTELLAQVGPDMDRTLHTQPHGDRPAVVLVVGVNGTGKTTTCGKLARVLVADGQHRAARRGRHVPRRRGRPAADLGRAGRRPGGPVRPRGRRPGERRVRRGQRRASSAASTWSSWTPPAGCTPRPG